MDMFSCPGGSEMAFYKMHILVTVIFNQSVNHIVAVKHDPRLNFANNYFYLCINL